jgi:hypothetical protein
MGQSNFSTYSSYVKLTMTKADASRLFSTLQQNRDLLNGLIDPMSTAQRDFLNLQLDNLRSAMKLVGVVEPIKPESETT